MMRNKNMIEPQNPQCVQTAVMCWAVDNLELLKSQLSKITMERAKYWLSIAQEIYFEK